MLRIIDETGQSPPQVLAETAFIAEVEAMVRRGAPIPSWTIEALDGLGKCSWRAYCSSVDALESLARQLRAEQQFRVGASRPDDVRS